MEMVLSYLVVAFFFLGVATRIGTVSLDENIWFEYTH